MDMSIPGVTVTYVSQRRVKRSVVNIMSEDQRDVCRSG